MMILNEYTMYRIEPKINLTKINVADSFKVIRNYARNVVCGFELRAWQLDKSLGVLDYKGNGIFTLDKRFNSEYFNSEKDFYINQQKIHLNISDCEPSAVFDIPLTAIHEKAKWWFIKEFDNDGKVRTLEELKGIAEMNTAMFSTYFRLADFAKTPDQKRSKLSKGYYIGLQMRLEFNSDFYNYFQSEADSYQAARRLTSFTKIG